MRRFKRQSIIILGLFALMLTILFAVPTSIELGLIQDRILVKAGDFEFTTGDVLTLFAVFGSCVTIGVWIESRRRR